MLLELDQQWADRWLLSTSADCIRRQLAKGKGLVCLFQRRSCSV